MTGRLTGKTTLLTAAGQGIGRATALAFAAEGAQVIATDINEETLASLGDTAGITVHRLDVTEAEAVAALAAKLDGEGQTVDCLFNCAGFVANGSILDGSEADWDFSFALNVHAMHRMTKTFLPGMLAQESGSIINMSSVASSIKGVVNRYAYSTTKAAVIGMTKAIAADYVTKGIRCNAICPGTVDSPSMHQRLRDTGDYEAALSAFIARQPMGRIGTAEEIAAMAIYLASDESKFTTGQALAVDGGWSI
ncbi:MAG: SDR family oxidoreductase [Pseudomonadota bacterium]